MKFLFWDITRRRSAPSEIENRQLSSHSGWVGNNIVERFLGAWQRGLEVADKNSVPSYWAVFACITLISSSISKCGPPRVMQYDEDQEIWVPTIERPVLRHPNHYQTVIDFYNCWSASKLSQGNSYIYTPRNPDGSVGQMHVLDPNRVRPMIGMDDGSVWYGVYKDPLATLNPVDTERDIILPANQIIHDRMYTMYHPLIGVSPIHACGVPAMMGIEIQSKTRRYFQERPMFPGQILAPEELTKAQVDDIRENLNRSQDSQQSEWPDPFQTPKVNIPIFHKGTKYEGGLLSVADAAIVDQLKMTAEMIASCFHVPPYKIGQGPMPTVNNTSSLDKEFYSQCIQQPLENMEYLLEQALGLTSPDGRIKTPQREIWFQTENLLRMDPAARYESHGKALEKSWKYINEVRKDENLPPIKGGDRPFLQHQQYPIDVLAERTIADIRSRKEDRA